MAGPIDNRGMGVTVDLPLGCMGYPVTALPIRCGTVGAALVSDREQLKETIRHLHSKAEDGSPEAMFLPGVAYAQSQGAERNDTAAVRWFHRAASKGHSRAKASMAYPYATGSGVRRDPVLGYGFLAQAVRQADPLAADLLTRLRSTMSPFRLKEAARRAIEAA